ncbi:unnamed protein product, partial [Rotaria magnacalcarata]
MLVTGVSLLVGDCIDIPTKRSKVSSGRAYSKNAVGVRGACRKIFNNEGLRP